MQRTLYPRELLGKYYISVDKKLTMNVCDLSDCSFAFLTGRFQPETLLQRNVETPEEWVS